MATKTSFRPFFLGQNFEECCDGGIVFAICILIFVLPASIALLDSFAALAAFLYLVKKIYRICVDWPLKAAHLDPGGKLKFIWFGFAPPPSPLNLPLQFLALSFFISVIFSHYPGQSFVAYMGKFVKCVFLYFSFLEAFSKERYFWLFINSFFFSAFIACLSGASQHFWGKDFIKGHVMGVVNEVSSQRVNSTFYGANGFGAYLLPVIGLAVNILFTALFKKKSWILSLTMVLILALFMACMCWTYSRSAWFGFLVMAVAMVVLDWRKIPLAAALLLVFYLVFVPSLNQVRNVDLMNDNSTGQKVQKENLLENMKPDLKDIGSGRKNYWRRAVEIIHMSPVFGTGLNTYAKILKKKYSQNSGAWYYAHNCYLQLAAETGFVGLAVFLWFLYTLFHSSLQHCWSMKSGWPLTFLQGAVSGLAGFLFQSAFDNTFYTVQLGVLMWVLFGFAVAATRLEK